MTASDHRVIAWRVGDHVFVRAPENGAAVPMTATELRAWCARVTDDVNRALLGADADGVGAAIVATNGEIVLGAPGCGPAPDVPTVG